MSTIVCFVHICRRNITHCFIDFSCYEFIALWKSVTMAALPTSGPCRIRSEGKSWVELILAPFPDQGEPDFTLFVLAAGSWPMSFAPMTTASCSRSRELVNRSLQAGLSLVTL